MGPEARAVHRAVLRFRTTLPRTQRRKALRVAKAFHERGARGRELAQFGRPSSLEDLGDHLKAEGARPVRAFPRHRLELSSVHERQKELSYFGHLDVVRGDDV